MKQQNINNFITMKQKVQPKKIIHHHHPHQIHPLGLGKNRVKVRPQNIALTNRQKNAYVQFNLFELQLNRLAPLPEFEVLAAQISGFNNELDDWKKKNIQIKNIHLTYHLYLNLFSRIRFTSNLFINREEAKKELVDIAAWFFEQKPKVRNKAPQKEEGHLKPQANGWQAQQQMDRLLITSKTRRDLQVYEAMPRKSHTQFFPPKERLLDYQQKPQSNTRLNENSQRRSFSVSKLAKIERYRGSFISTMETFRRSAQTTAKESQGEPAISPFKIRQVNDKLKEKQSTKLDQMNDEQIKEVVRQKTVVQEIILQQNIIQGEQDQDPQDAKYQLIFKEEAPLDNQQQYLNADYRMIAQQNIKDAHQSTLRRIIQKEEATRSKMEDLNIAQKMMNWAAIKSRFNSEENTKLERRVLGNNFSQLQFMGRTFEERQSSRKKSIPQYSFLHSQSSRLDTIEKKVQKLRIDNSLKKYGKYIQHVQLKPVFRDQGKAMKSSSLTHLAHRKNSRGSPFSKIVDGVKRHNEDALENVLHVKERLAKRAISIEKKNLLNAFGVLDTSKIQRSSLFPQKSKLLSNPFFPKQAKSKKKK